MRIKTIALLIVLVAIIGAIYFIQSQKPEIPQETFQSAKISPPELTRPEAIEKAGKYAYAPELQPTGEWINSEPLTIEGLKGKVVLIDFWTYSCINCIRTLPYLTQWHSKYSDEGLVIIGVHTPEFAFEQVLENVKRAVEKHGINYAVVQDNEYRTWRAFQNRYWPRKYLVDIDGFIRYDHIGEGAYAETELKIQELLKERMERFGMEADVEKEITLPEGIIPAPGKVDTPEVYFGYGFRRHDLGNKEGYAPEKTIDYSAPETRLPDVAYNSGTWTNKNDYMELGSEEGRVLLYYGARDVNIVASSEQGSTVEVFIDGEKISPEESGIDVSEGKASIGEERLYSIVSNSEYKRKDLELKIKGKGFRIYTFTFG